MSLHEKQVNANAGQCRSGFVVLPLHLGALVHWLQLYACLKSRRSRVRAPLLPSSFKERNTKFFLRSLVNIQCCEEPPLPRGRVLGLRPPGLEFRILCLEGSVISFILSHTSQEALLAQFSLYVLKDGLKPH